MQQTLIIVAFAIYLLAMLAFGVYFFRKSKTLSDYFLGGRNLNPWVAAMSAQASDMSGWLLMGLPGAVYAFGTGQLWIGVGLAIGTILNWCFIAKRLRRYTIKAGDSLTLPEYFENRFRDKTRILRIFSSIFIIIFFLVYTASAFAAGGKLFTTVFNVDYQIALLIGVAVILIYTFLGGFSAVCWTDFVQGMLMLVAILAVPIIAFIMMGGVNTTGIDSNFFNPFMSLNSATGTYENLSFIEIISQLGWALGYFGMPHILVRFMAIKSDDMVKKSRIIAIIWVILALGGGIAVGVIGREFVAGLTETGAQETVFMAMILKMFTGPWAIIGGILLCGILAAVMSTADSQLLVTATSISGDVYKGIINKKASDKSVVNISRIAVVGVAIIAYFIARDPNSSVMDLVSNAWAGFGATFGPIIVLSLFWKRTNLPGAIAGMVTGGITVIIWDYIKFGGETLGASTGLYSLIVGFALSLIAIIVVSLLTKEPSKEIQDEFDEVKNL